MSRSRTRTAAASAAVPSRFSRLANTHAAMAAGDATMTVALADSVLFSLDADAARSKVLLFLGISFVPFLFVAPLIGPVIDRLRGGRRFVIQSVTIARILISLVMAFHTDDLLLFPLAFAAMVLQKTYTISKSALVPSVVRTEEELVEANSKLGLISGIIGAIAVAPAALVQKTAGATATLLFGALWFVLAFVHATRLPREVVAARAPGREERIELHSPAVVLASSAMTLLRAAVGFTFFHLFFWFSRDEGFVWFGVSIGLAAVLTMAGNAVAPLLRHHLREEVMLAGSLALTAVAGVSMWIVGGVVAGVVMAGLVNFGASVGRLAFDSIVQRDAPDANQGRAFAQFETRFQFGWVIAGAIPVLIRIPGPVGFAIVGVGALLGAVSYVVGGRALDRGRTPFRPFAAMRRSIWSPPDPSTRRSTTGRAARRGSASRGSGSAPRRSGSGGDAPRSSTSRALPPPRAAPRTPPPPRVPPPRLAPPSGGPPRRSPPSGR